jgi:hypothetical protein
MKNFNRYAALYLVLAAIMLLFYHLYVLDLDAVSSAGMVIIASLLFVLAIILFGESVDWKKILSVAVLFIAFSSCTHPENYSGQRTPSDSGTFRSRTITFIKQADESYKVLPANYIEIVKVPRGYLVGDTILEKHPSILAEEDMTKVITYRVLLPMLK